MIQKLLFTLLTTSFIHAAAEPQPSKREEISISSDGCIAVFIERKPVHIDVSLPSDPDKRKIILKEFIKHCDHVESLYINYDFTDQDAEILASGTFKNLKKLDLANTQLTDVGTQFIAAATFMDTLISLDFSRTAVTTILPFTKTKSALERLVLAHTKVTDRDVEEIVQKLPNLKTLILRSTKISSEACTYIASAQNMRNLTYLDLGSNSLGIGLEKLLQSPHLSNLTSMIASHCGITDKAVKDKAPLSKLTQILLEDPKAFLEVSTAKKVLDTYESGEIGLPLKDIAAAKELVAYLMEKHQAVCEYTRICFSLKVDNPEERADLERAINSHYLLKNVVSFWYGYK